MEPLPTPSLTIDAIAAAAALLDDARSGAHEVERLSVRHTTLNLADAYAIQGSGIGLRMTRGERVIGYKMGLTSKAKREQMNLHAPIYGVLTDRMRVHDGVFTLKGSIHPKIEPEIAFFTARELSGNVSEAEALAALSGVAPALEILDSRYVGFKYFSLPDVVADNSSSSMAVVGEPLPATKWSLAALAALAMDMRVGGTSVAKAMSAEISGNPLTSLVQLCTLLAQGGRSLPAGSLVLTGAATQAVQLERGMQVELEVETLGKVAVRVA